MNRLVTFAAASVVVALVATTVQAQTVLVDMGTAASFRGVSTPSPTNGNFWNNNAPGTLLENLVDITGSPTTIGVGWFTPVATDSFNGPAGATSFPHPTAAEIQIARDKINNPASQAALGRLAVGEAIIDYAASAAPGSP